MKIELIHIKSTINDWGWIFFPAKEKDRNIFYHCTGVGMEYMLNGGIVDERLINMVLPVFELHGREPVLVNDISVADWKVPVMKTETGHLPAEES